MSRSILVCLILAGCAADSSETTPPPASNCPPESTLTYDNFASVLITDKCLSCHASRQLPILGTREAIQQNSDEIVETTVSSTLMPKGTTTMTVEERQLLGEWLACGAP